MTFQDWLNPLYTYSSLDKYHACTPQQPLLSLMMDVQCQWWFHSSKKTFATIAWDKEVLPHKVWSLCTRPIPLKTDSVIHDRQCEINLKVVTARMVIQILFRMLLSNVTFDKKTHHNIHCVDHPVQCPEENLQVVSVCVDSCQVVYTISIISVSGIEIIIVFHLCLWSSNSITRMFPYDTPLDCHTVTPSNFVVWKKRYLFFVLPSCSLQVVRCSART
jgi:hypothetical protein